MGGSGTRVRAKRTPNPWPRRRLSQDFTPYLPKVCVVIDAFSPLFSGNFLKVGAVGLSLSAFEGVQPVEPIAAIAAIARPDVVRNQSHGRGVPRCQTGGLAKKQAFCRPSQSRQGHIKGHSCRGACFCRGKSACKRGEPLIIDPVWLRLQLSILT